jgi:hypothetical protein
MMILCSFRAPARSARRRRPTGLPLEPMEERLAPSSTLAYPPPQVVGRRRVGAILGRPGR